MQSFQDTFETCKRSFICGISICMNLHVPLRLLKPNVLDICYVKTEISTLKITLMLDYYRQHSHRCAAFLS